MLRVWDGAIARPTRDIDFLGRIDNSPEAMEQAVRACLGVEIPEDGLVFEDFVSSESIILNGRYPGIRLKMSGHLDGARFVLRLDVSIDDATVPEPDWAEYPTLLGGPRPRILVYHPATAVAEKFEAIVSLGLANSRMKDFYDLWMLATTQWLEGEKLRGALVATFAKRGTPLPSATPAALTEAFYGQERVAKMWKAFVRKLESAGITIPSELAEIAKVIIMFIMPVASGGDGARFAGTWTPSEGWRL